MALVYYGLDILMINSFIYYSHVTGDKMNQKQYRIEIINELMKRCKLPEHEASDLVETHDVEPEVPTRLNGKLHIPTYVSTRGCCEVCKVLYPDTYKNFKTYWLCKTCGDYVCMNKDRSDHFERYHTNVDLCQPCT